MFCSCPSKIALPHISWGLKCFPLSFSAQTGCPGSSLGLKEYDQLCAKILNNFEWSRSCCTNWSWWATKVQASFWWNYFLPCHTIVFQDIFLQEKCSRKKRWWLMTTAKRNPKCLAMMNMFWIGFRFCHISYNSISWSPSVLCIC